MAERFVAVTRIQRRTTMPEFSEPTRAAGPMSAAGRARSVRVAVERELGLTEGDRCSPPGIPDHEILHRIGSGAYGDVWLARSTLGTLRAVKIVYRARFEDDRPYEREFHGILKYEPISRTHEGLVQVLHVGRNDAAGCFYYMMELADAVGKLSSESAFSMQSGQSTVSPVSLIADYSPRTLHSELRTYQRLAPANAAQVTSPLASALAHLHAHGLVHRDIKPSNVIFVNGRPKLADIGLVAGAGDSRSFVGTEGFVPPEGPGTTVADIYSLGKLLYELATGRDRMDFPQLPEAAESPLKQSDDEEALLELNEVITRACAPRPEERYASAVEMHSDLQLFLAGRSLREVRTAERHLNWMKRIAAAAAACVVISAVVVWLAKDAERVAQDRARNEADLRARAQTAEYESRQQLYTALLEQARATTRSGELGHRVRALDALRRAATISNTVELRREVFAALALPDLRLEREWQAGESATSVSFDSGFDRVAIGRGRAAVEIRSVPDFRLVAMLPPGTNLPSFHTAWNTDGRYLAVRRDYDGAGNRAALEVWDVAGERRVLLLRDVPRGAMAFHPRLPRFAAGTRDGRAIVWDVEQSNVVTSITLPAAPARLAYSPDGKKLAATYPLEQQWSISVHDVEQNTVVAGCRVPFRVDSIKWHPSGQWIAAPDYSGAIHLMDARSGETSVLGKHKSTAVLATFSPDGRYLMTGGWERELICWDVRARQRAFTMPLDSYSLQYRADGRQCAVVSGSDQRIQLHAFESPAGHREFSAELGSRVNHAAFSPDGRWLAASGDQRLGLWDLTTDAPCALADEATDARPYFTPDSTELFGSSRDDSCFRWRIAAATNRTSAPRLERVDLAKPSAFTSLCFASNSIVWTSSRGSRVAPWQDGPDEKQAWVRTSPGVNQVSADGKWLGIFRPFTPFLYVYRLPGLERVAKLTNHANILSFNFSPVGNEVAVASRRHVEFWDITTGRRTRELTNFMGIVFAADGRHAWLTRDARTAGLYDLQTLEPRLLLPTGTSPIALSPDGHRLAVSVDAQRLQVWNLTNIEEQLRALGLSWDKEHQQQANVSP